MFASWGEIHTSFLGVRFLRFCLGGVQVAPSEAPSCSSINPVVRETVFICVLYIGFGDQMQFELPTVTCN